MTSLFRNRYCSRIIAGFSLLFLLATPGTAFPQEEQIPKIFYYFQFWLQSRDTGSGPDKTEATNDMHFRRNRLGFTGEVSDVISYYVQAQYEHTPDRRIRSNGVYPAGGNEGMKLLDSALSFYLTDAFQLQAGMFKPPFSRSNNEGCSSALTLERSAYIYEPYRLSRDNGFAVWGNLLDAKLSYRLGLLEGRDGDYGSNLEPHSNFRYQGRLHLSLLDPEADYGYLATYLGGRKVLTIGAGVSYEPSAVFGNLGGVEPSDEKDYTATTVDLFFEYPMLPGTFTFTSAMFDFSWDGAYKGKEPDTTSYGLSGERNGYYVDAAFMPRTKIGSGEIQVFVKYEDWKFARIGTVGNQGLNQTEGGINYFIGVMKFTLDYSMTAYKKKELKTDPTYPAYQDFNTTTFQVQMIF
ncbi:MAG: selenite/tellurite reduction operon porin ExtI [Nitrospinota bacterium]|nr:selenite/tellurite reduction operon porin ExtI [Nitrospinota bacterium]